MEEHRGVHPHWWRGSAAILGLTDDDYPNAAFGVTPAVLSTIGSVITTSLIRDVFEDDDWQQRWLGSWSNGTWWSEYTLYRLALDIRGLFDNIHVASESETFCNPVWYTVIFLGMQWVLSATKNVFSRSSSRQHSSPLP